MRRGVSPQSPGAVLVRDSKCPAEARPTFGPEAWAGFVEMTAVR
ncbi:DUF397 domain-containing protein [Streptomyces hirsutus]